MHKIIIATYVLFSSSTLNVFLLTSLFCPLLLSVGIYKKYADFNGIPRNLRIYELFYCIYQNLTRSSRLAVFNASAVG